MYIKNKYVNSKTIISILLIIFLFILSPLQNKTQAFSEPKWSESNILEYKFKISQPNIQNTMLSGKKFHKVTFDGSSNFAKVGEPKIPFKTIKLLIPSGFEYNYAEVSRGTMKKIQGDYVIEPSQFQTKIGSWDLPRFQLNEELYDSVEDYPSETFKFGGIHKLRGYNILVLNLYPISYIPSEGEISYTDEMLVKIHLKEESGINFGYRSLQKDKLLIEEFVDNPDVVETYQNIKNTPSLALSPGSYDYIIITNNALKNSAGTYTFQDLAALKNATGIQTRIITTEYIYLNYIGIDEAEKIRNFIIDAYNTWGVEYVLLGGDGDKVSIGGESGHNIIPARGMYATAYGEVDYNITSDLYYAGLDGNWNTDSDNIWGENGEEDLLAEVYVGRAPVDSELELSNFVRKTILHENEDSAYLSKALMVGEDLGWNPWGGDYKDEVKEGSTAQSYSTTGFPDSYIVDTLYDRDLDPARWNKSDLANLINDGVHIINHLGHCDVEYAMKMRNHDADALSNTEYSFIYSQGCYNGAFDNIGAWGAIHSNDSIVEHFVTEANGAFAFIANSRFGWGDPYGTDGASQYYDRQFFDAIFSEGIQEIGKANQDSKHDNIGYISQEAMKWVYYELNLFGDPSATLPPQPNDYSPQLSNEEFLPSTGDQKTLFQFNITYTDADDNPPITTDILINGTNYRMFKTNDADENYTDGCVYSYLTYLQPGDYSYNFQFADYGFIVNSGPYFGPMVTESSNSNTPSLSQAEVSPNSGLCNFTDFLFSVNYSDQDNNRPDYVKLTVNSTEYTMFKQDISDSNYMDGCIYIYELKFSKEGSYVYEFNCSDGSNVSTTILYSDLIAKKSNLFDGMSIKHIFTQDVAIYNSEFSYSFNSGTIFDLEWDLDSNIGYWKENVSDRIMTDSGGALYFGDGFHTPVWTFSDLNVKDTTYIAVDGEGDHLFNCSEIIKYILPDYGEIEICIMEDLTVPGGKAWYERSTGILLNGTFIYSGGSYNYTFDFVDTNVKFEYVKNEYNPDISKFRVDPLVGDQKTLFTFNATYTDLDDNQPSYVMLQINGTNYPMKKINDLDTVYTDGCDYFLKIYLQPGNYEYRIKSGDWLYNTSTLSYTNLTVSESPNLNAPALTNGILDPGYGYTNATSFIFSVNYTDIDNNSPILMICEINGTLYEMDKLDEFDTNYMDGCIFLLDLTFEKPGTYQYSFNCSDGGITTNLGPFIGPIVKSTVFFGGLYVKHNFVTSGVDYNSEFLYEFNSGDLFTNYWDIWVYSSLWQENMTNRIISDPEGMIYFGAGEHTPTWISHDNNIGNLVNISVLNDGDHVFSVTGDTYVEIENIGFVEAWVLEDLIYPSAIAYYEKNSGILLNGDFYYSSGEYSFEFIESNANMKYLPPANFVLTSNADNPDTDGSFDLDWTQSNFAYNYSVYEYKSHITEINNSLSLLASDIETHTFHLDSLSNGDYHYIITAHNNYGKALSNCVAISVSIPPPTPTPFIPGYEFLSFIMTIIGISLLYTISIKKRQF